MSRRRDETDVNDEDEDVDGGECEDEYEEGEYEEGEYEEEE